MELNSEQVKAVNHKSGPLLIIAGAGTGKTSVITERIVNIINKGWAKPSEILALTFTEKASNEMLGRVDVSMPYGYEPVSISTFHSFCDHLLKQEGIFIGLDPNYKLMTEAESYVLFRKHIFDMPLDILRPLGNPSSFISQILSHFSRLQDEDISPEKYIDYAKTLPQETAEEREVKWQSQELSETYKFYTELKIKESKLDFGDLIITSLKLFRTRPNILKKYHEKFKYILVDEFQDTNYTQNVLVNMLVLGKEPSEASALEKKKANITVVGDDDQSIYKFRGAAISNILQFKQTYPTSNRIVLNENYRSRQEILDAAHKLIENNNPGRLEVTESVSKQLISKVKEERNIDNPIRLLLAKDGGSEADKVVSEIKEIAQKRKLFKYSDIAILIRANTSSEDFVNALKYNQIPYKFGGYKGLYNTDEVKVLISFLKLVANYADNVAMFNVLNMDVWEFTPREIIEIMKYVNKKKESIYEIFESIINNDDEYVLVLKKKLSPKALTSIATIVQIMVKSFDMVKDGRGVGQILFLFFEKSGLKDSLLAAQEDSKTLSRIENMRTYFNMISEFEKKSNDTNLYEYLEYLDYSMNVGENPNVNENDFFNDYDAVNILTVHSAKGLEFPVVFLVNLVEDRFPTRMKYEKLELPNALINEVLVVDDLYLEHLQEERRLFYVGLTRAKSLIYLSVAQSYSGGVRVRKVSTFLNEVLGRDVNEDLKGLPDDESAKEFKVYQRVASTDLLDYTKLGLKVRNQFSYSQIASYEMCPRQYKYSYIIKLPLPVNASLSFGNTMHNTLRTFYEKLKLSNEGLEGFVNTPTLEDLKSLYKSYWQAEGYESKAHEAKRYERGLFVLNSFFEKMYSKDEKPMVLEKEFKYGLEDFIVTGKIDRIDYIGEKNGKKVVEIIDYKTGKAKSQKDANAQWQLVFYSMVAEELWGYEVAKASYIYVEHNKKVEVSITKRRQENVKKKIIEIVRKIQSGDFSIPPSHQCMYCNYQEVCEETLL